MGRLLAIFAASLNLSSVLLAQQSQRHNVVILYQYVGIGLIGGDIEDGMKSLSRTRDVLFLPEYVDTTRFPNPSLEQSAAQYLRSKYSTQKIDAVVLIGFAGLSFALKYGEEIFGDAPFVFVGVERSRLEGTRLPRTFTGVTHFDDVGGTVEGALQLQPDTKEVVVVAGTSEADQYWLRRDRKIFDHLAGRVRFRYLADLPMLALLRELSHLKPHSVVFVHSFSRDGAGQAIESPDALDLIAKNANVPVYRLTNQYAVDGIVGGRPSGDGDRRFSQAFEIVGRILAGEKVADIPIQETKAPYSYIFDARQLRRWNIDRKRVPPGSLLLHEEPSFWQVYRKVIVGTSAFIALQSGLILILLIQRARRRKAEALLADRNVRLQQSERSLRQLSGQLICAQEDERKRIARELHDDLNQQVADLGLSLSRIKREASASIEEVRDEISHVQNRLLTLSDGIRHISHELHPGILEMLGLVPALRSHCEESSRVNSVPVEFETDCDERVNFDTALCLYRIAQESLRNAAKYSRASRVLVRLTKSDGLLELRISDDGVGFDVEKALMLGGLGLRSMEERVRLLHGRIEVTSAPGSGTTVMVTIGAETAQSESGAPLASQTVGG